MRTVARAELVAAIDKPCSYCGKPMQFPTRDHIRPRAHNGTLDGPNKTLACEGCNVDKGAKSIDAWLYRLDASGDPRALYVAAFTTDPNSAPMRAYIG